MADTARAGCCSRVQNLFHSVQLNVNNPHFLIMQGRITKVRPVPASHVQASIPNVIQWVVLADDIARLCNALAACMRDGGNQWGEAIIRQRALARWGGSLPALSSPCCFGSCTGTSLAVAGPEHEAAGDPGHAGGGGRHAHV